MIYRKLNEYRLRIGKTLPTSYKKDFPNNLVFNDALIRFYNYKGSFEWCGDIDLTEELSIFLEIAKEENMDIEVYKDNGHLIYSSIFGMYLDSIIYTGGKYYWSLI